MKNGWKFLALQGGASPAKGSAGRLPRPYVWKPASALATCTTTSPAEAIIEALAVANLDRAAERFARIAEGSNIVAALLSEIEQSRSQRKRAGQPLALEMLAEAGRNPALATILRKYCR